MLHDAFFGKIMVLYLIMWWSDHFQGQLFFFSVCPTEAIEGMAQIKAQAAATAAELEARSKECGRLRAELQACRQRPQKESRSIVVLCLMILIYFNGFFMVFNDVNWIPKIQKCRKLWQVKVDECGWTTMIKCFEY